MRILVKVRVCVKLLGHQVVQLFRTRRKHERQAVNHGIYKPGRGNRGSVVDVVYTGRSLSLPRYECEVEI